jgi:hypothetical protein
MPETPPSSLPTSIKFRLIESDEFLDEYAIRHLWTPFEAACVLRGVKPISVEGRRATVGVSLPGNHAIEQCDIDGFASTDPALERDLLVLAQSIEGRWANQQPVASEVVEWALGKGIGLNDRFVQKVLGRIPDEAARREIARLNHEIEVLQSKLSRESDGRGAHHQENRLAILGFAITELALNLKEVPGDKKLVWGQGINSSAIADLLHDNREALGMPADSARGFSHRSLENVLRDALAMAAKVKDKISSDKK